MDCFFLTALIWRLSNISAQGIGVSRQLSSSYAIKTKCVSGTAHPSEKSRPIYTGFKEQVIPQPTCRHLLRLIKVHLKCNEHTFKRPLKDYHLSSCNVMSCHKCSNITQKPTYKDPLFFQGKLEWFLHIGCLLRNQALHWFSNIHIFHVRVTNSVVSCTVSLQSMVHKYITERILHGGAKT